MIRKKTCRRDVFGKKVAITIILLLLGMALVAINVAANGEIPNAAAEMYTEDIYVKKSTDTLGVGNNSPFINASNPKGGDSPVDAPSKYEEERNEQLQNLTKNGKTNENKGQKKLRNITVIERLRSDHKTKKITVDKYILYLARATFKPENLKNTPYALSPEEAKISRKYATLVILEIKQNWNQLSRDTKEEFKWIFLRPTETSGDPFTGIQHILPKLYETTNFVIHWTNGSDGGIVSDAPDLTDSNSNRIPDYIENFAAYFEETYSFEITTKGFDSPPSDSSVPNDLNNSNPNGKYDVFVYNLGANLFGYASSEQPSSPSCSYMAVNKDFSWAPPNDDPDGYVKGAMKVTVAHEYFHAVQFTYDIFEEPWWMETTSTYMEDEVYPQVNDNYNYLPNWFEESGNQSLTTFNGNHEYGSFIWAKRLSEDFGDTIINEIWNEDKTTNGLIAINNVLQTKGTDLINEFKKSTTANYFLEDMYVDGAGYRSKLIPRTTFGGIYLEYDYNEATNGLPFTIGTGNVNRDAWMDTWAADYVRIKMSGTVSRYKIDFDGLDPTTNYQVSLVTKKAGVISTRDFALDANKDGTVKLTYDPGYSDIILIIRNSGNSNSANPSWSISLSSYDPTVVYVGAATFPKEDIVFKTDSDPNGNMDQYLFRVQGPINFRIFTYADKDAVKNVRLVMRVYDIDQQGVPDCGPEVDRVSINGNFVGDLTGANGQWSIVSFPLDKSWVKWMGETDENYGVNSIRVDIDVTGSDCWATQVDWAEIRAEQRPLVFVPGIAGTELYSSGDLEWVAPLRILFQGREVPDLALDQTGNNPLDPSWNIQKDKIIRKVVIKDIYGEFIDFLRKKGYFSQITIQEQRDNINPWFGENPLDITPLPDSNIRFFEFPYDWRKDLTQTTNRLAIEVQNVKQDTGYDQVFLVAHSMGGLVSRKFIKSGGDADVKMLLTMGTPYYGAAKAYYVLKVGEDLTGAGLLKPEGVRIIAQNMSAVYHLLPTEKYWRAVTEPVFDDYPDPTNDGLLSITQAYLTDPEAKLSNPTLVDNAIDFHNSLGSDFGSVREVNLVIGTGQSTTKEWIYLGGTPPNPYYNPHTGDGDGTVPYGSAYAQFESGITERKEVVGEHVGLPGNDEVQQYLWDKIKGAVTTDPTLTLTGFTDYGLDTDSDGLYDYLAVRFNSRASTAGNYTIRAQLNETQTTNRSIVSTAFNKTSFNAGETKELSLLFRGDQIHSKNYTGQYTINTWQFYNGIDQNAINNSIYTTSSYTPSQFEPSIYFGAGPVTLINASDSGIDTDGDGLYNHLQVTVTFNITTPGNYRFLSFIYNNTPNNSISIGGNELSLSSGVHTITFNFSGSDIYRAGLNTSYNASYSFDYNKQDNYTQFVNVLSNVFYNYTQFDPVPAYLSGSYTDRGVDTNSNGLYEYLTINVTVNVTEPGDYTLQGSLLANVSNGTNLIATAMTINPSLSSGVQDLHLRFTGERIFLSGINDSCLLGNVNLISSGGVIVDSAFKPYKTARYNYTSFEPPTIFFAGNTTETALDTNINGFYDTLRISVKIQSKTTGYHYFNARLTDKNGSEIQWISGSQYIISSTPTLVNLSFTGSSIFANGKEGLYLVKDFSVYNNNYALTSDTLYTTSAYNYTDFEHVGGQVRGRVTYANGTGVSGQIVAVVGATFTTTSSNGDYTIGIPTAGIKEVIFYPTHAGNWWTFVNGTYTTKSTRLFVEVASNATTIVDFTQNPPLISNCVTTPTNGCLVNRTITLNSGNYNLPLGVNVIADDITIDCNGATISGYPIASYNSGLNISGRSNVTVKNCRLKNFFYGIDALHTQASLFENNTLTSNAVGMEISGNTNTVVNTNSSNNRDAGLYVLVSNYTKIQNVTLNSNSNYGLYFLSSSNNTFSGNNASNNIYGIYLNSSNNNTLSNNNASSNSYGIYLRSSNNNTLAPNKARSNSYGIYLDYYSSNNTLNKNNVSSNYIGIYLTSSGNNMLSGNNVSSSSYGLYLYSSSNNTIFNNYLNNTNNFQLTNSNNRWNTTENLGINMVGGPYFGGNFWANPSGTGFSQTCADGGNDGICDSSYTLGANNVDYLPLSMNFTVDTTPPASITNLSKVSFAQNYINWTWINPSDADFNHTVVYLNGTWKANISGSFFKASGLAPDTVYEIETRTVDKTGNMNTSWINSTARTAPSATIQVMNPGANPAIILNDNGRPRPLGTNITRLNVTVSGNVASVTINLSLIGGTATAPMTRISGTDIYSITTNATSGINLTHYLVVNASDTSGNFNNSVSIPLTVLLRGDIVRDNKIDLKDLLYMRRYLAGLEPSINMLVADIQPAQGDGYVDLKDLLYLRRYLAGLEPVI